MCERFEKEIAVPELKHERNVCEAVASITRS